MPDEIPGINILAGADGTALPAQTQATLTSDAELIEAITKNSNFPVRQSGDIEWVISSESLLRKEDGEDAIANGNVAVKANVDLSGDGTKSVETIPGLQSVTLSLEQTLGDVPPGIDQPVGWNYFSPENRDWTIDIEGHYYDPANNEVHAELYDILRSGRQLDAELDVFGLTFSGKLATDSIERSAGTDGPSQVSLSYQAGDELTRTGTADTPIEAILGLFFDQTKGSAFFRHMEDGTQVTGATSWEGDVWLSTLELTMERDDYPRLATELQGNGELSMVTS